MSTIATLFAVGNQDFLIIECGFSHTANVMTGIPSGESKRDVRPKQRKCDYPDDSLKELKDKKCKAVPEWMTVHVIAFNSK